MKQDMVIVILSGVFIVFSLLVLWDTFGVWILRLSGGRPMKYKHQLFVDTVNGKDVNLYVDKLGREWMAQSAWSWFRVRRGNLLEGEGCK